MYNSDEPKKDNSGWWIVAVIAGIILFSLLSRSKESSPYPEYDTDYASSQLLDIVHESYAETASAENKMYEDDAKFEALCAADPICSGSGSSDSYSNNNSGSSPSGCPSGCTYHKSGCDIKGNVEFNTGERIYHLPNMNFYNDTIINSDYGERWFCAESEAISNGWRKANN